MLGLYPLFYGTSGPKNADIMFVGESWGNQEYQDKGPFIGASGQILNTILEECGINRDACFCSNVIPDQPQGNNMWRFFQPRDSATNHLWGLNPSDRVMESINKLYMEISIVRPKVIYAVGNWSLWCLTDALNRQPKKRLKYAADTGKAITPSGIMDYRGSMLRLRDSDPHGVPTERTPVIPLIHPAAIMRDWAQRTITKHDIKTRGKLALKGDWEDKNPPRKLIKPTLAEAREWFRSRLSRLDMGYRIPTAADIETPRGLISCIGFCDDPREAFCLPFIVKNDDQSFRSYWEPMAEAEIISLLHRYMTHPKLQIIGQNWTFDMQWLYWWLCIEAPPYWDTMTVQHMILPGTPIGLGYISSLYCHYHTYWKDDGRDWDKDTSNEEHYEYNAEDALRTFEAYHTQRKIVESQQMWDQFKYEMRRMQLAWNMMKRGAAIDAKARKVISVELFDAEEEYAMFFQKLFPQKAIAPGAKKPWYRSPQQMQTVLYDFMQLPVQKHKKTKKPTTDKTALEALTLRYPELKTFFTRIEEYRSIGVFRKNFIMKPLDPDGRMRCSYNIHPSTFRWSSSGTAFNTGTNLQTIPEGTEDD